MVSLLVGGFVFAVFTAYNLGQYAARRAVASVPGAPVVGDTARVTDTARVVAEAYDKGMRDMGEVWGPTVVLRHRQCCGEALPRVLWPLGTPENADDLAVARIARGA
jgi:hypothetical protein